MIRPALPADVPALLALIRELARYEKLEHEVVGTADDLQRHLFGPTPRAEAIVATDGTDGTEGETLVGLALYFHNFSTFLCRPGLYLEDLFVLPEHRGKGYGAALLRALAAIALERGCGRLEWSVLDWNEPAKGFYRSLGAQEMSDWRIMRVTGEALQKLGGG
jgi:GNAT superfamily N-acetyltransferase